MRNVAFFFLIIFLANPLLAQAVEVNSLTTTEAPSGKYWQEFDLTFWQTAPFAAMWLGLLDGQLSASLQIASPPHWAAIIGGTVIISVWNAYHHAKEATASPANGVR